MSDAKLTALLADLRALTVAAGGRRQLRAHEDLAEPKYPEEGRDILPEDGDMPPEDVHNVQDFALEDTNAVRVFDVSTEMTWVELRHVVIKLSTEMKLKGEKLLGSEQNYLKSQTDHFIQSCKDYCDKTIDLESHVDAMTKTNLRKQAICIFRYLRLHAPDKWRMQEVTAFYCYYRSKMDIDIETFAKKKNQEYNIICLDTTKNLKHFYERFEREFNIIKKLIDKQIFKENYIVHWKKIIVLKSIVRHFYEIIALIKAE